MWKMVLIALIFTYNPGADVAQALPRHERRPDFYEGAAHLLNDPSSNARTSITKTRDHNKTIPVKEALSLNTISKVDQGTATKSEANPSSKVYITFLKKWKLPLPSASPSTSIGGDTKLLVMPLGFLLAFLIGLAIKATHWWNEDIRHADGLLVNVYTPHAAPRRVLARIYSTEPHSEDHHRSGSIRIHNSNKGSYPGKMLLSSQHSSRNSLFGSNSGVDDEVFDMYNMGSKCDVNTYRPNGARSKTSYRSKRPSSVGSRSPTESLCSRCKIETIGSGVSERDLRDRINDPELLDLYKMAAHSPKRHMRKLKRQMSSVSTQSTSTVRSESSSESAPLLLRGISHDRLNRYRDMAGHPRRKNLTTTQAARKPPQVKKVSPLARRANSESHIELHRIRSEKKPNERVSQEDPKLASLNALLKNSLTLNITLLNTMSLSGAGQKQLKLDGIDPSLLGQDEYISHTEKPSPNHTSQESSYLSSSDIASSASAGTSITALFSSLSSTGSIYGSRHSQGSIKRNSFLHNKLFAQFKESSKAVSDPTLKISNKTQMSPAPRTQYTTIGDVVNPQTTQDQHQSGIVHSRSSTDNDVNETKQVQPVLCRSTSMGNVRSSKTFDFTSPKSKSHLNFVPNDVYGEQNCNMIF